MKKVTHQVIICEKCNKPFMAFKIINYNEIETLKVCPYCLDKNETNNQI